MPRHHRSTAVTPDLFGLVYRSANRDRPVTDIHRLCNAFSLPPALLPSRETSYRDAMLSPPPSVLYFLAAGLVRAKACFWLQTFFCFSRLSSAYRSATSSPLRGRYAPRITSRTPTTLSLSDAPP